MNRQEIFIEMMSALIGKSIAPSEVIGLSKVELEQSCARLSDLTGNTVPFVVDMDSGYEPCPFICSSNRPFDFVWIGLNPGGVLKDWQKFSWQNTTWRELANFCVPKDDIRASEKNIYHFLKKDVESKYYKFFLRFHAALIDGEIYNDWTELTTRHSDVEKFFVERFSTHSILNAELVPYKSDKTCFTKKNFIDDTSCGEYFRLLIRLIETETAPDAWIVFFGARDEVLKLLQKFAPDWRLPNEEDGFTLRGIKKSGEEGQKNFRFYFFTRGRQKILLSPFLRPDTGAPIRDHLELLINELNKQWEASE